MTFFWHTQFSSFGTGYLRQNRAFFPEEQKSYFYMFFSSYNLSSIESFKDVRLVRKRTAKRKDKKTVGGGEEFEYLMIYGF